MRLRPNLVLPPRIQAGARTDRRVTWLESFSDLIFVVAIGQLAARLLADFSWLGFLKFAILLVIVWWAWVGQTFYTTRFDSDDLWHRVMTMIQMFFVAALSLQIGRGLEENSNLFALTYGLVRAILIYEYLRAGRHIPKVRPLTVGYSIGFSIAVAFWCASAFVPLPYRFVLWAIAMTVDYLTPTVLLKHARLAPPHASHVPERFGLFTLIVIGESILNVVTGMQVAPRVPSAVLCGCFAWVIAFGTWWCYFDGIRGADSRGIDDEHSANNYRIWMYTHLPLTMGIVGTAVSLRKAIPDSSQPFLPAIDAWMLVVSTMLAMMSMNVIFAVTPEQSLHVQMREFIRAHVVTVLLAPTAALVAPFVHAWVPIGLIAAFWLTQVTLALREDASVFRR